MAHVGLQSAMRRVCHKQCDLAVKRRNFETMKFCVGDRIPSKYLRFHSIGFSALLEPKPEKMLQGAYLRMVHIRVMRDVPIWIEARGNVWIGGFGLIRRPSFV